MEKNKEQEKRLDYLLEEFKADSVEYKNIEIPEDINGKRSLLRSLMNVRMPKKMSGSVLKVQDEYLSVCAKEKGIVQLSDIPVIRGNVSIWQGDITRLEVDAIVNAANSQMLGCFIPMHMCIDNQIHTYAGIQLRLSCNKLMTFQGKEEETGKAKITPAFNLPSKYIIHTVGPIVYGELTERDRKILKSCYYSCLKVAENEGLKSIAFCCISTGEFHFPNEEAAKIAVDTVYEYRKENNSETEVVFNVFKDRDYEIYRRLLGQTE
mgnify:CR=1 FL=1